MTPARLAAARALVAIEAGSTTLSAEVETGRAGLDDRRDRGLLLDLVAGTLRWRNALDGAIDQVTERPLAEVDPAARAVLRLGTYQIRHLDRIPAHAVVHESVETVKALGASRASGFVNAILRNLLRRGAALSLPARPTSPDDRPAALAYLTVTLSHPAWLVERWLDRYGFDATEAWCQFNNAAPEVTVRAAPEEAPETLRLDLAAAGIEARAAAFAPDMLRLAPGMLGRVPDDLRRRLLVQEEGSMLVGRVVGAHPGDRVLDLCAAPGGKTLVMADALQGSGVLVACDHRRARMRLLRASVERHPAAIGLVQLDAARPLPFLPGFDRVLVDAPCSGLGTLRRDPDLKWSRQAADLARFAALQAAILRQASDVVRPGGHVVYATCSSEPEENAAIVRAHLDADPRFAQIPIEGAFPQDPAGALETRPDRHGLDAFYAAVLVRRSGT